MCRSVCLLHSWAVAKRTRIELFLFGKEIYVVLEGGSCFLENILLRIASLPYILRVFLCSFVRFFCLFPPFICVLIVF